MNFEFNEDQLAIRELAYQIFTDRASDEFMLKFSRSGKTYDDTLWNTLAEQGLLGIAIPESAGGSGLGFVELCLILEEQGRRVAPTPMFSSLVLGGLPLVKFGTTEQQQQWLSALATGSDLGFVELCLILEEQGRRVAPTPMFSSLVLGGLPLVKFGTTEQQQQWLSALATGSAKLTAAIAEVGMNPALATAVTATKEGDNWVLSGKRAVVPDGSVADCILVPAVDADGQQSVFLLDTQLDGVTCTGVNINLLGERAAHLELDKVVVSESTLLGSVGQGQEIVDWIEEHANVAHCALQVGVTEEAMKRTAAYLCEREQFGVPLGSFQALAMRMADSYIDVEAMRSTYWLALWRLSEGLPASAEVRAAKWWACDAAARVVQTAQHHHGGIGADLDYPIHRFFLNAKYIAYSLGNGSTQLDKLGTLLASDDSIGFHALEI